MRNQMRFIRRLSALLLPLAFAGCSSLPQQSSFPQSPIAEPDINPRIAALYAAAPDERFPIPEVDLTNIDAEVLRSVVRYATPEPPGTLIISTTRHTLHLVLPDGMAVRYGVGVGKDGLAWSGRAEVGRKAEWPRWTPTADMIRRDPALNAKWSGGMDAGLDNPLGARALYLHQNGRDTLYRIHGTNDPASIGLSLSSGCIRMFNQDVIDLYNRVQVGSRVIVGR